MQESELLTRERACEHVIHAIAEAREELLTPKVVSIAGGLDTKLQATETGTHWTFGGYVFAMSGTATAVGAAAVVTAPLEVPTLLVGGGVLALWQGVSLAFGAKGELKRMLEEDRFKEEFGFPKGELRWSVIPAGTRYWYLQEGDTMLELVLKAKRGLFGFDSSTRKQKRLLEALCACTPDDPQLPARIDAAVSKAASDLGTQSKDGMFQPACAIAESLRLHTTVVVQTQQESLASKLAKTMLGQLLTRERACEHVIHAIAEAREELLTPKVVSIAGGLDTKLQATETGTHWTFGGYVFAMSGTATAVGAAAVVTAPLEVPTLLVGGGVLALWQGVSLAFGAKGELKRMLEEDRFKEEFGFPKGELRWSVIPAGTRYWYLQEGDTMLELVLKAKRGLFGFDSSTRKQKRLLEALCACTPDDPQLPGRIRTAWKSAERALGDSLDDPSAGLEKFLRRGRQALEDTQQQARKKAEMALKNDGFALESLDKNLDGHIWSTLKQFLETSDPKQLGKGKDVTKMFGEYNELRLASVWEIKHPTAKKQYEANRDEVVRDMKQLDQKGKHALTASPPGLPAATAQAAATFDFNPAASEAYLLHSTDPSNLLSVLKNGLNERFSGTSAGTAFGDGVYLAEDPAKTDQYAKIDVSYDSSDALHTRLYGNHHRHQGSVFYVLVCRTLLGYPARTQDVGMNAKHMGTCAAIFPSTFRELATIPGINPPIHYHSLIAEKGKVIKRYREFVVFHGKRVLPMYLLAYNRCHDRKILHAASV